MEIMMPKQKEKKLRSKKDQELYDFLIEQCGEDALTYMTLKNLKETIEKQRKLDPKIIDFKTTQEYRVMLDRVFSEPQNFVYLCEFESDLKKVWPAENVDEVYWLIIEDCLDSFDEYDEILMAMPELLKQFKNLRSERDLVGIGADFKKNLYSLLKQYLDCSFDVVRQELNEYDGKNVNCKIIIDKLKSLGFFNKSDNLISKKSQTQPE